MCQDDGNFTRSSQSPPDHIYAHYISASESKDDEPMISMTGAMDKYGLTSKDIKSLKIRGHFHNEHAPSRPGKLYWRINCQALSNEKAEKRRKKQEEKQRLGRDKEQRKIERERKRSEKERGTYLQSPGISPSKSTPSSPSKTPKEECESSRAEPYDKAASRGRRRKPPALTNSKMIESDGEDDEKKHNTSDSYLEKASAKKENLGRNSVEDQSVKEEVVKQENVEGGFVKVKKEIIENGFLEETVVRMEPRSEKRSRRARKFNYAGVD